ncbi:hypothetical protein TU62_01975 [Bacillus cereus]|nr:hypothetical protein TU62_01975 [Bacillus cereus]
MNEEELKGYYPPNKEKEDHLWKNGIFIFDTSALLEFYYFPKKSQQNIFNSTFEKLVNRLWIPNHVKFEYLKNRENTLRKPIEEKYKKLENTQIKAINEDLKSIKDKLIDFINHTKKQDVHPYIDTKIPFKMHEEYIKFEKVFSKFEESIKTEFKKREDDIIAFAIEDTVMENFNKYFKVGREYSFEEILKIVKEGEFRYRNEIPPGYKDASKKSGTQKYGDLIIWKQIIEYAKQTNKPIIFITNDVKEDWCYQVKRGNEVRIARPKEDLITEIKAHAKVDFWMYTFSQFLYIARDILKTNISQEVINEALTVTSNVEKIRFDGYYKTLADDLTEEDIASGLSTYESYYYFFDDGTIKFKCGDDSDFTYGIYTANGENIKIEFEYPKDVQFILKGRITDEYLKLEWSNSVGDFGSEKGFFYKSENLIANSN